MEFEKGLALVATVAVMAGLGNVKLENGEMFSKGVVRRVSGALARLCMKDDRLVVTWDKDMSPEEQAVKAEAATEPEPTPEPEPEAEDETEEISYDAMLAEYNELKVSECPDYLQQFTDPTALKHLAKHAKYKGSKAHAQDRLDELTEAQ